MGIGFTHGQLYVALSRGRSQSFGGKTILFGDEFRQILLAIQRGNCSDIVHASYSSKLQHETKAFDEWILKIGECNTGGPNDGEAEIEFPEDVVVRYIGDHIYLILSTIYPSFENHLDDQSHFQDKAILVLTDEEFDATNDYILGLMKDEGKTYMSSNCLRDTKLLVVLNGFQASRISNHKLPLKIGVLVILLCNIDQTKGLCNGLEETSLKPESNMLDSLSRLLIYLA
uniref:DNA helicase Pif1-like 2B domain-containing protein n=1 Tax=Lactuca sativa TaxID=4236 RepID=A0A9R1X6X4_LACSA|nr:hypothetical protein LSAT_V11C600314660 [Lactuca sativa]